MTQHLVKVLIIDEDTRFLAEATAELSDHFTVYTSTTGGNGLKMFAQLRPQVVIVDAGISDTPFAGLLEDLKELNGAILRIATSRDYSAMETVMQAIVTSHIHRYFRKPLDYLDLIGIINARTGSREGGWSIPSGTGSDPAYEKLHTILDKAKETEKLRLQLEVQPAKIRDGEEQCFIKAQDTLEETRTLRKRLADQEAPGGALQARILELEELKKRDLERAEWAQMAIRQEMKGLQDKFDQLLLEKNAFSQIKSDNEKLRQELEQRIMENSDLRVSVPRERETMLEEMARERRALADELAGRIEEAERIVEMQKERNRTELQSLQDAHEEEKQRTVLELERHKAEFDADCKAKLAEIEADRRDRRRMDQELVGMRARMAKEKEQLEKSVQAQRKKAEADISLLKEFAEEEQKKLTAALEASLAVMKKTAEAEAEELRGSATRELDRFRTAAQKKEHELSEALVQAQRVAEETGDQLRLTESRIKILEGEIEKHIDEKDRILQALESVRSDFKVAIQSRDALVMEVAEQRHRLG